MRKQSEYEQLDLFAFSDNHYQITKPVRLIEFFAGIGFQRLGIQKAIPNLESWKITEWAIPSIIGYDAVHNGNNNIDTTFDKEFLINKLYELGISTNYNEPANKKQIQRLGLDKLNKIYNCILRTHNLVNIMNVKGEDLEIKDTNKYEYILTYSFPCQDLTISNTNAQGMSVSQKDGGTRSGLVWEVLRIISECKEKPQILLMENVIQIHSKDNIDEFNKLQYELEKLGYRSFWKDMIGNDYGVPQTRNRTFMISIHDENAVYSFPQKEKLTVKLQDLLEKEPVDEKYYLTPKFIDYAFSDKNAGKYKRSQAVECTQKLIRSGLAATITTRAGERPTDNFIFIPEATEKGYTKAYEGDGVYTNRVEAKRGTVQRGMIQTIKTTLDVGVVVKGKNNG